MYEFQEITLEKIKQRKCHCCTQTFQKKNFLFSHIISDHGKDTVEKLLQILPENEKASLILALEKANEKFEKQAMKEEERKRKSIEKIEYFEEKRRKSNDKLDSLRKNSKISIIPLKK